MWGCSSHGGPLVKWVPKQRKTHKAERMFSLCAEQAGMTWIRNSCSCIHPSSSLITRIHLRSFIWAHFHSRIIFTPQPGCLEPKTLFLPQISPQLLKKFNPKHEFLITSAWILSYYVINYDFIQNIAQNKTFFFKYGLSLTWSCVSVRWINSMPLCPVTVCFFSFHLPQDNMYVTCSSYAQINILCPNMK